MENKTPLEQHDALRQKLARLEIIHATLRPSLRGRWIRFAIRESLTAALYIIFWKYAWVRWSLYLIVPLVLVNLLILSTLTWGLPRKIKRLNQQLEHHD